MLCSLYNTIYTDVAIIWIWIWIRIWSGRSRTRRRSLCSTTHSRHLDTYCPSQRDNACTMWRQETKHLSPPPPPSLEFIGGISNILQKELNMHFFLTVGNAATVNLIQHMHIFQYLLYHNIYSCPAVIFEMNPRVYYWDSFHKINRVLCSAISSNMNYTVTWAQSMDKRTHTVSKLVGCVSTGCICQCTSMYPAFKANIFRPGLSCFCGVSGTLI